MRALIVFGALLMSGSALAGTNPVTTLTFAGHRWRLEAEQPSSTRVHIEGRQLQLQAVKGLTLWLATPLRPPYEISYQREVDASAMTGLRISDMNQFWAAQLAPDAAGNRFHRSGAFASYEDVDLYYFGIGGNNNGTTRFRHYDGQGQRQLLTEYLDAAHRLYPGHVYQIRTVVQPEATTVYIDGQPWFHQAGTAIGTGWFGLRLTGSSQRISHFQIRSLP
ncbi:DUF6250 domain-containing protein [Frateuria aurantia]